MKRIWPFRRKPTKCACNCDKLVSVVAKMTGRPVEVKLDGKVLVFKSKEFDGVLDGITNSLKYR